MGRARRIVGVGQRLEFLISSRRSSRVVLHGEKAGISRDLGRRLPNARHRVSRIGIQHRSGSLGISRDVAKHILRNALLAALGDRGQHASSITDARLGQHRCTATGKTASEPCRDFVGASICRLSRKIGGCAANEHWQHARTTHCRRNSLNARVDHAADVHIAVESERLGQCERWIVGKVFLRHAHALEDASI